jgi:hypothetical protein
MRPFHERSSSNCPPYRFSDHWGAVHDRIQPASMSIARARFTLRSLTPNVRASHDALQRPVDEQTPRR